MTSSFYIQQNSVFFLPSIVSFWKSLYQDVSLLSAHGYYLYKQLNPAVYSENKQGGLCQALLPQKFNLTTEQQTEKLGITQGEKIAVLNEYNGFLSNLSPGLFP